MEVPNNDSLPHTIEEMARVQVLWIDEVNRLRDTVYGENGNKGLKERVNVMEDRSNRFDRISGAILIGVAVAAVSGFGSLVILAIKLIGGH